MTAHTVNILEEGNAGGDAGLASDRAASILNQGAYLPCKSSFLKHVYVRSAGRVINFYNDIELNAVGIPFLQTDNNTSLPLNILLLSRSEEIAAGVPVHNVIDMEVKRLRKKSRRLAINSEKPAIQNRGSGSERHAADIDGWIKWFFGHRQDFCSRSIASVAVDRCISWHAPFVEQSPIVIDTLSLLGVDGSFKVNDCVFLCRDMAMAFLDQLAKQGVAATMSLGDTLYGCDAYMFLQDKHGEQLPQMLCNHGVYAITYGNDFTCFLV